MIPALDDLQTFCVGRMLIDLPKGTTVSSAYGSNGDADFSATTPTTHIEFERLAERRWREIQAIDETRSGRALAQPATRVVPVEDSHLFAFHHSLLNGPDVHGQVRERLFYDNEALLWRDDVLYSFSGSMNDRAMIDTMKALRPRADDAIPTGPGFCGPSSFFPGGGYRPESVHVIFRLPGTSGLALTVEASTSSDPNDPPTEPPRPDFTFFKSDDFDGMVHRDAKRTVAGREGVEWGMGVTERTGERYETQSSLRWFTPGKARSADFPKITITLDVIYKTDEPPSPWGGFPAKSADNAIDEETFMTYWDVLLDTLRLRPGAAEG